MPDDFDNTPILGDQEALDRIAKTIAPVVPAFVSYGNGDQALDGSWQAPPGGDFGFDEATAGIIEIINKSLTNVLEVSFDSGTTTHKTIPIGEGFKWDRRNDDGSLFRIRGTAGQPYVVNAEK